MCDVSRRWYSALFLILLTSLSHGQNAPEEPPALKWDELLKCELVVVGQFKSHKDATLTLEVVDVLRGQNCKAGDLLPVTLAQSFTVLWSPRYGDGLKSGAQIPRLSALREVGPRLEEVFLVNDAEVPHIYFFPSAKNRRLDRVSQIHADRRAGWKQALAGKPIELTFRLLQTFDPAVREKAIAELFRTHDRTTVAALVDVFVEPRHVMGWFELQPFLERLLVTLGDRNGSLYDPVLTALRGKPGQSYDHAFRLARVLARADNQRAAADFKKLLESGSRVSRDGVCWALHNLESEAGLDLQFELIAAGESQALDSLCELMFNRQGIGVALVQRAKLQDLAVPRLQKLLKAGTLRRDIQGVALYHDNFRFLVEEVPANEHWRLTQQLDSSGDRLTRKRFPDWDRTVYEASGDLEPMLRADLGEGRKLLAARLANPEHRRPYDQLISEHFAYLYGDTEMRTKYKKPADPIVRYRDTSSARYHRAPYSEFMKLFADTRKLSDAYWARIAGLFPHHPETYFRELTTLLQSSDEGQRYFAAVQQLQKHFFWDFDLDPRDFAPVRERKLEALKPLFGQLSRGTLLDMRAAILRHFGVKLEGSPSKAWLPALHTAALSWNATITFNAFKVMVMLEEDVELMRFAHYPLSQRKKALDAHLAGRAARLKEARTPTPTRLEALWLELASDDRATGYAAMQAMLEAPQSAVAWFRQHLREAPQVERAKAAVHIADLSSRQFKVRVQATEELKKLGLGVVPHLRQALKQTPDLETCRRLEAILRELIGGSERAREVRAVQVLEYLPGPAARTLLEELAAGPRDLPLTDEATDALERLKRFWQW